MKTAKAMSAVVGLVAVLATHPVRAQNVFAGSNYNNVHLPFAGLGAIGVALTLPAGTYVVNAKVSVHNLDSDSQPASCVLNSSVANPFDRTDVRMDHRDGGDRQSVALQGVLTIPSVGTVPGSGRVFVTCVSFNADASDWVITAVQVPGTFNVPPCTNPPICSPYTPPPL
jgi:hypothetical protein